MALTLVVNNNPAPVVPLKPKPASAPVDPVREAAVDAATDVLAAEAMHDAVERLLATRNGPHGRSSLSRLLCDAWRAGAVYGYQAAPAECSETMADVIRLHGESLDGA